jgi:hypothetical protein
MYSDVWLKFGSSQPFRIKATANQIIEDLKEAFLAQHSIEFQSLSTHNITIRQGDSLLDPGSSVPLHTMSNNPLIVDVIEGPQGNLIQQLYFQVLFFHSQSLSFNLSQPKRDVYSPVNSPSMVPLAMHKNTSMWLLTTEN